jgi:hypothetical protein
VMPCSFASLKNLDLKDGGNLSTTLVIQTEHWVRVYVNLIGLKLTYLQFGGWLRG